MCSYLHAAFSVKREEPDFSPLEAAAVARWRKKIPGVATEEMIHLLLASNLSMPSVAGPTSDDQTFRYRPDAFHQASS